ncbi:hypothetical protein [Novosphingobium terrae]|uniref:hypothetical protein n=1 Tax=Novosphingobium terrae TaxID=2726189 RepID=UPI001980347C|nr:hypothetical protein [Novosphingobium terrae]
MFVPMLLISVALLSAGAPDAFDRISPQAAAKRVAACGVGAVTVRSDVEPNSDVLLVMATTVSDAQLNCIDRASSFYDVVLSPSVQPRFDAIRDARFAALATAENRKWLTTHNILNRLPKYESGVTDDKAFAREIEKLCDADGAFQSQYGPNALSPEWVMQHAANGDPDGGPMACLMNVTYATGFKMGFIGNERVAP